MNSAANTEAAEEIPAIYRRKEILPVPTVATPGECGFTSHARDLATAVRDARNGETWQAYTRTRYMPHRLLDDHSTILVVIDTRTLVAVDHHCPAGTNRDLWTIRVNGHAIPHRVLPREVPHQAEPIARSVWRHRIGITVQGCDTLGCHGPALVATWRRRSMCRRCARRYIETGH